MAPKKRAASSEARTPKPPKRTNASAPASAPQVDVFQFLQLPGGMYDHDTTHNWGTFTNIVSEIRNEIYSYCRPEGPQQLHHHPRPCRYTAGTVRKQSFLSLAHVNKQIRDEVLPVYMHGFNHSIKAKDIPAYAHAFPTLPKTATGTITIDVQNMLHEVDQNGVNFASLLRLRSKYREVTIDVTPDLDVNILTASTSGTILAYTKQVLIHSLFTQPDTVRRAKWLAYADKAVKELWIVPVGKEDYKVRVVVKSSYAEWWMGWNKVLPSIEPATEPPANAMDWAERSGYPGSCKTVRLSVNGPR
jgi:hypothetical protein